MIKRFFSKYFELLFWIAALVSLALTDPARPADFSLCPLKAIGFTRCPGCGLGHAISWIFQGDLRNSFHTHWLGIPALAIILYRIYTLIVLKITKRTSVNTSG